ncbi:MAG: zinc ribbon domain-containing protein [Nitrospirales bacterium]|nr:zinc ribbon domain-containing protein [Nitrospirales bacterium]
MPIYEYRCLDCQKRNVLLIINPGATSLACKFCQSHNLERLMSRFAAPKSEEARMEALADPSNFADLDEQDPKSMARLMKKMSSEMGEDLGGDLDEALEGMEGDDMAPSIPDAN